MCILLELYTTLLLRCTDPWTLSSIEMSERVLECACLNPHVHRTFSYLDLRIHYIFTCLGPYVVHKTFRCLDQHVHKIFSYLDSCIHKTFTCRTNMYTRHLHVWTNMCTRHSHVWTNMYTRHSHVWTKMSTIHSRCFFCTFSVNVELIIKILSSGDK